MIALHLSDSTADIICNTGLHGKIRTVYPRQCFLSHGSGYFSFALLINTAPLPKNDIQFWNYMGSISRRSALVNTFHKLSSIFLWKLRFEMNTAVYSGVLCLAYKSLKTIFSLGCVLIKKNPWPFQNRAWDFWLLCFRAVHKGDSGIGEHQREHFKISQFSHLWKAQCQIPKGASRLYLSDEPIEERRKRLWHWRKG